MTSLAVVGWDTTDDLRAWAARAGFTVSPSVESADVVVEVVIDPDSLELPTQVRGISARQRDERHRLERESAAHVRLTAASHLAVRLGFNALARGLIHGMWPDAEVQWPRFAKRGVIEGFYGPPWSHPVRLGMIDFLADHDFNLLVLAPKDEASQRLEWRAVLDDGAAGRLAEIVSRGARSGVDVAACVAPGLSIHYSSEHDLDTLVGRMRQFYDLGVRSMGLLLDDIAPHLQFDDDRRVFGGIAEAHGSLVTRLAARIWEIDPAIELSVCPLVYHGMGDEEYLVDLGRTLHPRVDIMWTGREICSRRLDLADAAQFARSAWRPPLYWDNYPVNDVAMVGELHIGPLEGRDPHLYRMSAGLVSNAMDRAEASKIPFATIGDYLRDPEHYEPFESWSRAITEVAGDNDHEAFERFAENVLQSCLNGGDAPSMGAVCWTAGLALIEGDRQTAVEALSAHADVIESTAAWLLRDGSDNPVLIAQCEPWIRRYAQGADALRDLVVYLERGSEAAEAWERLQQFRHSRQPRIFGDTLQMFLEDLAAQA